jgi:Flp pilus assembly protein TadD
MSEDTTFGDAERVALLLNLAACHLKRSAWAKAVETARAVLAIDQNSAKAHYRLAAGLLHTNEFEAARDECLRAMQLEPQAKEIRDQFEDIR